MIRHDTAIIAILPISMTITKTFFKRKPSKQQLAAIWLWRAADSFQTEQSRLSRARMVSTRNRPKPIRYYLCTHLELCGSSREKYQPDLTGSELKVHARGVREKGDPPMHIIITGRRVRLCAVSSAEISFHTLCFAM